MATTYGSKRQAYADPRNRAPLERGGKPNKPISRRNPRARFAIFLKNEANHTLASLAAMAQFALVALPGSWFGGRRPGRFR